MAGLKECACCGGDAGRFPQWFNQDTGYGICARCVAWIRSRGETAEDVRQSHGVEGKHFAKIRRITRAAWNALHKDFKTPCSILELDKPTGATVSIPVIIEEITHENVHEGDPVARANYLREMSNIVRDIATREDAGEKAITSMDEFTAMLDAGQSFRIEGGEGGRMFADTKQRRRK